MGFTRRQLLGAAGASGMLASSGASRWWPEESAAAPDLPHPGRSGIRHIVVVMMENRSFDHFLGWLPGADGRQAGLSFRDRSGVAHPTHHLRDFAGCGFHDPDHSFDGGRIQLDHGRCDGWLRSGGSDLLAIGYYGRDDLGFLGRAAQDWTTFDRYFSSVMAPTYPNRLYLHAGRTDRLHNGTARCTLPTIWDRLRSQGVSGAYYYGDVPFTALWHRRHLDISHHFAEFVADAAAGTLPAVSFVDPRFADELSGRSDDDHPHADIRAGEAFLDRVYDAVRNGPGWRRTVLVITYDEWGGFFDHVPPGRAADLSRRTSLRGFRVPAVLISPLARRGHVAHHTYDHASVLRMIEWRWRLRPLAPRDRHARNLAEVLDFRSPPDLSSPTYGVPPFVPTGCGPARQAPGEEGAEWSALRRLALRLGWRLPQ